MKLTTAALLVALAALVATSRPAAAEDHIIFVGSSGHVYDAKETSGYSPLHDWVISDATATAGAPAAVSNSTFADYFIDSEEFIYFVGTNQHIYDFYYYNGTYHYTDETAQNGAPLAACTPLCGNLTGFSLNGKPYVYYLGVDGHIHENWSNGGNVWQSDDPTALSGAPAAASNSSLMSFRINGERLLYYCTSDGHVHEVKNNGGPWIHTDITAVAHGPSVISGAALAGFSYGLQAHVYYATSDNHLHRLYSNSGSPWVDSDLNTLTAAPTVGDPLSLSASSFLSDYHILYKDPSGNVIELYAPVNTTSWGWDDASQAASGPLMYGHSMTNAKTDYYDPFYYIANLSGTYLVTQLYTEVTANWQVFTFRVSGGPAASSSLASTYK